MRTTSSLAWLRFERGVENPSHDHTHVFDSKYGLTALHEYYGPSTLGYVLFCRCGRWKKFPTLTHPAQYLVSADLSSCESAHKSV